MCAAGACAFFAAIKTTFGLLAAGLGAWTFAAFAEPPEPEDISVRLERIRQAHEVPALAAAAVDEGTLVALGATGRRRVDGDEPVLLADSWQIGSCTKSMTAAVCAMLVEDGTLRWDSTLAEVFPDLSETMDAGWRAVTLEDLLWHLAGAPHEPPLALWIAALERHGTPTEQRFEFTKGLLYRRPAHARGTHWSYSDSGYAIAGAMMERASGLSWEELLRERLFVPLGLESAGFGEPATPERLDEPWGHQGDNAPYRPVPPELNTGYPPAISPAAAVYCSINDLARYAAWQVAGARGKGWLLEPESFQKLQTPPESQGYAMGWVVSKRRWAGGKTLMHQGQTEMFYAVMWLAPGENTCFVATCNADGWDAETACDEAIRMMINRF